MSMTAAIPGCPVDESFDPLSAEFLADPYSVMAALDLDATPVFYVPSIGYYVITRYSDIEAVFRDPASYLAAVAQAPPVPLAAEAQQILLAGGHKPQPSMVSLDEPEHARLDQVETATTMAAYRAYMRDLVAAKPKSPATT